MKKTAILCVFAALAVTVLADETYDVVLATADVSKLDLGRTQHNTDVCLLAGEASTCSQAEACTGIGAACAGSCTNAQALAAGCRIYANTPAGRDSFFEDQILPAALAKFQSEQVTRDKKAATDWCVGKTLVEVNQICNGFDLGPGCYICGVPPES